MSAFANKLISNWQASAIATVQSGLPFSPQLGFNPTNDGNSRNPIRPSWNPAFTGNVILGGLTNTTIPTLSSCRPTVRMEMPGANIGGSWFERARPLICKEDSADGAPFNPNPKRAVQHPQSHQFQSPNPIVFTAAAGGAFLDSRRDHLNNDDLAADSVWLETALVAGSQLALIHQPSKQGQSQRHGASAFSLP